MIRLDTTTRKLQVILAGAPATNQLPVVCSWSDDGSSAYSGGVTPLLTTGITAVDIVAAPGASTVRDVDHINIYNADTASVTVTVRLNDNATLYTLQKITLLTGESLVYTHSIGWRTLDTSGQTKVTLTGTASAFTVGTNLTVGGTLGVTGASTVAALTASGLITANAGLTVASGQTLTLTGVTVAGAPTWSSSQAITLSTAAQPNVTSTGALTGGSIASGFGTINIGSNSLTAGAISGTTGAFSGSVSQTAPINTAAIIKVEAVSNTYEAAFQHIAKSSGGTSNTWTVGMNVLGSANALEWHDGTATRMSLAVGGGLAVTGTLTSSTGFGCNGKTAQTAYASGGVLANVVAALVANGILSN